MTAKLLALLHTLLFQKSERQMGHHIDEQGRFQSDKYPDLPPDKIVVSFRHARARAALSVLAEGYASTDPELAEDIRERLRSVQLTNSTE